MRLITTENINKILEPLNSLLMSFNKKQLDKDGEYSKKQIKKPAPIIPPFKKGGMKGGRKC
jgi:hypothetical protein